MNMRFSRSWWTSTSSATISVSLIRTSLHTVTFLPPRAGCMIILIFHSAICWCPIVLYASYSTISSASARPQREQSLCVTLYSIFSCFFGLTAYFTGNQCVIFHLYGRCKMTAGTLIINYKLGGSEWYWSNLVCFFDMGLDRLAKMRDATELSVARLWLESLHNKWGGEKNVTLLHATNSVACWDARTHVEKVQEQASCQNP